LGNKQVDVLELYKDPRLISAIEKWNLFNFLDEHRVDYIMDGKNVGVGFIGVRPCIFCGDNRNHFGIHKEKKYGSCFICKGFAGPLKLVSYYGHMNIQDAFNYLINDSEDERDVEQRVRDIIYQEKHEKEYKPDAKDIIPDSKTITIKDLRNNFYLKNFFKERKLHLWHVKRYDLRLTGNNLLWVISVRNRPVSYQKRNILLKKYYIPQNLPNYIYGEDHIIPDKPLLLVEGFLDYTRIDSFIRCQYPGKISVTTGMVKSVSNTQIKRIINRKPSKIIVMYDNDSWFDYWRIRNSMPMDVDFIILPKGLDPNDLTWQQIKDIFKKEIINALELSMDANS
jgi:hypothetical protein